MAKPTTYPEWASGLVVDPISGQDNRVEPTVALKTDGWPRVGFPPRQYANWQFYQINNWVEYLDTAVDGKISKTTDDITTGDLVFDDAALSAVNAAGDMVRVLHPQGGMFSGDVVETGYVKITLPVSWTNTMVQFDVDLYIHADSEAIKMRVCGYNRLDQTWQYATATVISERSDRFFNVRFGHDGTKCAIYIGEVGSTWDYPQISVSNFVGGFQSATPENWADGWAVGITTSLGTITDTRQLALVASNAIGVGQTWQDVQASRAAGVTYTNTTGRSIMVAVTAESSSITTEVSLSFFINGVNIMNTVSLGGSGSYGITSSTVIVPTDDTYKITLGGDATPTVFKWWELR